MKPTPNLVQRLAGVATRRASHPAVIASDHTLSYAQLERATNRLAHRLRERGIGPGSRVGICLPRGASELVTILAVAKAGAAHIPLDPLLPAARLKLIVDGGDPNLVVTTTGSPLELAPQTGVVLLDDLDDATEGFAATPIPRAVDPDALAYIMFTSGSTGRPKGVEVTQGALSNFLASMAHTPGLAETDRLLAVTTTAFDISGLELLGPLWVGGTVVIADADTIRDPQQLAAALRGHQITVMQATPVSWRLLLESGWRGDGRLRILCGGEAMSATLARGLLRAGREVWNMYGPTETTIWSSVERIAPDVSTITIGRPIDRTRLYLLRDDGSLAPPGAEGEIGIGGAGLARGYRSQPALTAERFLASDADPDGRIYRTGDVGRRLPCGRIEWLGRVDNQVKINGNRIELGEIETTLRGVPGVAEVVVTAQRGPEATPRLLAYVKGKAEVSALRATVGEALPMSMHPALYIPIDAFPMTPNGKIDRKALPLPAWDAEPGTRPRNDAETRIAEVWCEVLGLSAVPVDRDFFTLGGTSVRAIEVATRLKQKTGLQVPLKALFETPTVEAMAARLGERPGRDDAIVVELAAGDPQAAPLLCLCGVHLYQDLAIALGGRRRVVGMHVPLQSPQDAAAGLLGHLTTQYLAQIQRVQPCGPYHLLGLCFGGVVAFEVARALEAAGETVAEVVVIDAVLPSGRGVDLQARVAASIAALPQALDEPGCLLRWGRRQLGKLASRLPALRPLVRAAQGSSATEIADGELDTDGPEVSGEVLRFDRRSVRLDARVTVVRATGEPTPPWVRIDATQGWHGRGRTVEVLDIDADHLGVLREPHVRALADAVAGPPSPAPVAKARRCIQ